MIDGLLAWRPTPYALAALVSALISAGMTVYAWRRRSTPAATPLALFMLSATEWSLTYALELGAPTLATKLFWAKIQYLGITSVSLTMIVLVLEYIGRRNLLQWRFFVLTGAFALTTMILAWTNEAHHLIWTDIRLVDMGTFNVLDLDHGPWFWAHVVFSYLLLLVGSALLLSTLRRSLRMYRGQTAIILLGTLFPWLANLLYVTGLNPFPHLDLTPFAFTLTGIVATWGLFHFRLLDVVPVARSTVVESLQDGVIVLDAEGRVVDVNPVACRLIGHPEADIVGRPASQVLAPWHDLVERYRHVNETHTEVITGEGAAQRTYDLRISPLHNQEQQISGRVIIFQDITDRKQVETELRAYQAQLERQNVELRKLSEAMEQTANTIVITDPDGTIEYVNPAFTRITGYSRAEALGKNPRILKSGAHDAAYYQAVWETILAGDVWRGEFLNRRKDDTLYWEDVTIAPVQNDAGDIASFIAIKTDITARKEAEQALQESQAALRRYAAELEAQNAELDAYAHTVAHDLKNPLSAIAGFTQLLISRVDRIPPDKQREMLQIIQRTTDKMHVIIDELLLLASVRTVEAIEREPLDMADIVDGVRQRLAPMIDEYQAHLSVPSRWPTALGYAAWIEEVWVNYVSNALKYGGTPPQVKLGYWVVDPHLSETDTTHPPPSNFHPPPSTILFWVRDNGPGLTPEQQARLFTPFERLDTTEIEGHGLGLTIVERIVEKLGGEVGVTSEVGQGSTFWFTLPRAQESQEQSTV